MLSNSLKIGTAAALLTTASFGPAVANAAFQPETEAPTLPTLVELEARASYTEVLSASEFISKWTPSQPLYVEGSSVAPKRELAELHQWLTEHNKTSGSNWTVLLVQHAANYDFKRGSNDASHGVDGYIAELKEHFVSSPQFNALLDKSTNRPNGALLFVSLDRDGQNRKMILWTKDYYKEYGAGHDSSLFQNELFPRATALIRDQGRIADGVKEVVANLDIAASAEMRSPTHISSDLETVLIIGGITVVAIGALALLMRASPRGSPYSGGGGSTFIFFDGGSGGGGCGGGDCGGGSF